MSDDDRQAVCGVCFDENGGQPRPGCEMCRFFNEVVPARVDRSMRILEALAAIEKAAASTPDSERKA